LAIADFCLLYGASVVLFCEKDDENRLQALFFLRKLLQLGITARPCEFAILFAILIRQGDADPRIRGQSVDVLAQLADHSGDIYARLAAGSAHSDQVLAAVCTDAVQRTTSRPEALSPPNHEDFPDLPPEAPPDVVAKILTADKEALLQGRGPADPALFVRNALHAVTRFANVPLILERGSECLRTSLSLCESIPVALASQMLTFCFGILSGESFDNDGDSFDAVEAVQNLANTLFEMLPPVILLSAIAAIVVTSTDQPLPLLLNKLNEYVKFSGAEIPPDSLADVAEALDTHHPEFSPRPDVLPPPVVSQMDAMQRSIERLLDPETVFEEMEAVIADGDSRKILDYPVYLRGFLQRAFFLFRHAEPIGMSEQQRTLAASMAEQQRTMTAEDLLPGGRFALDTLTAQLEELKRRHES
jgi:hypothetical protein